MTTPDATTVTGDRSACLFCRVVDGFLPATVVHRDERFVAFRDLHPVAPVHVLVVPVDHYADVAALSAADPLLAGGLLATVSSVARAEGLEERGWRTVFNTGPDAGQTVFHVHAHVIGGETQGWPTREG